MWQNRASLRDILDHSPFNTEEELLDEVRNIEGPTGTKIIIWNLRRSGFIPMVTRLIKERLTLMLKAHRTRRVRTFNSLGSGRTQNNVLK